MFQDKKSDLNNEMTLSLIFVIAIEKKSRRTG
jgi:hypothetical protein